MAAAPDHAHGPTRLWPAVLAPVVLAWVCFWPALSGGFLSDDYLLGVYLDGSADRARVAWSEVLRDFARPWLGFGSPFYRPLLSVSFAVDLAVGGGSPVPFHLQNLVLHSAVVAMTALLCSLYCVRRPALAALLGGSLCALHPVACEPVAWIAARNSELEVVFRTAAMIAFALWLKRGRRGFGIATALFAACALATKESAVVLPVALLALDLLDRPGRPLRERLRLHAPFVPLWIGYLALRTVLFGGPLGAGSTPTAPDLAANFGGKVLALLAPAPTTGTLFLGVLCAFAVAAAVVQRELRAPLAIGLAWIALSFAPSFGLRVGPDLGGTRMVYGTLPVLALTLACVVARLRSPLAVAAGSLLVANAVLALGLSTRTQLDRYRAAWDDMARAERGLAELAGRATPARPLAVTAMPQNPPGVPPCNPNAWFPLTQRPAQDRDIPFVSLGFVTLVVPHSEDLYRDAAPLRALAENGSTIATWNAGEGRFAVAEPGGTGELPALSPDPAQPGRFLFAEPVPAAAFEALEIDVDSDAAGGTVAWITPIDLSARPELGSERFGSGSPSGAGTRFWVDLSHHLGLQALGTLGQRVRGFEITLDGAGARVEAVRARRRVASIELPRRLDGERIALAELGDRLLAPTAPAGVPMRLVLLGPSTGYAVDVEPGAPVEIPRAIRDELALIGRIARQDRYSFYFDARPPQGRPGAARSAIDWFELR